MATIHYKTVARKSPKDKSVKYYAENVRAKTYTLKDIAADIEHATTVSRADIKACLDELETRIMRALQDGNSVRLGDLGSFRVTLQSKGAPTAKEFTAQNIKNVKMQFRPSVSWYKEYKTKVSYEKFAPASGADGE